jgi:ATP-dependent Lhr-like helicase
LFAPRFSSTVTYQYSMATDAAHFLFTSGVIPASDTSLAIFSPLVRRWFVERFGHPTPGQRRAWPAIVAGENLLLCAPTGSGKTLAAFLPILDQLATQSGSGIACVYVAPQKALAVDVRRNLRRYLIEMQLPGRIRIALRTGDTPPRVRRRMLRRPPDILLTTPESLAVMLAQPAVLACLSGVRWVVVDEVHALAGNKRGADLSLSLERLEEAALLPLQRIGLSATCAPRTVVATFLVGAGRPCTVAAVPEQRGFDLDIELLPEGERGFLQRLTERLVSEIECHTTTLIFTSARGLAERLTWSLRRQMPDCAEQIAVHHSSLAALPRRLVERRLKSGKLRAVVSSTTLELGVDIGTVERVVLVHPPGGAVRLLQRLGRSGHGPARTRRGLVLNTTAGELLEAAVTGAASRASQIESLRIAEHPLDVLCQHLVGLASARSLHPDEAFALVRRAAPYRHLTRQDFDDCVAYLCGRHPDGREWLPARLKQDEDGLTIVDRTTARLMLRNFGTILAEVPRRVRLVDGTQVGEVDEPYAEKLQPGDRFLLDGRCLEFRGATWEGVVEVQEVPGRPLVPRWSGDTHSLSAELSQRLFAMRVQAAEALRDGPAALRALLRGDYHLPEPATAVLMTYFLQQEAISEIPGLQTLLIECLAHGRVSECYVHTPLHHAGNDALARVAVRRLVRQLGRSVSSMVADLGLLLCIGGPELTDDDWRGLFDANGFGADLDAALKDDALLRMRFGQVAQTGLMVLRNPLGGRRKVGGADWVNRRLFEQVRSLAPAFVLMRQAAREAHESCDARAALTFAESVPRLTLRRRYLAAPSPFAQHWSQQVAGPQESAESPEEVLRRLHAALTGGLHAGA